MQTAIHDFSSPLPVNPITDGQMPIKIYGEVLQQLPKNLYIPPQALLVYLSHFEGPLDLLLYLIRSQGLSVLDIPMTQITEQYLSYIHLVRQENFELVAEYMAMAATLIDIKTRMLLPRPPELLDEESTDPRIDLAQRLLIYEAHKKAALALDQLPQAGLDFWSISIKVELPDKPLPKTPSLHEIAKAWQMIHQRIALQKVHTISQNSFSVREFIEQIDAFFQQFLADDWQQNQTIHQNINQNIDSVNHPFTTDDMNNTIPESLVKAAFEDIIHWQIKNHDQNNPDTLDQPSNIDDMDDIDNLNVQENLRVSKHPLQTFIIYTLVAILELGKLGYVKFETLADIYWLKHIIDQEDLFSSIEIHETEDQPDHV
jgi:chromatin segregation and condensation protein Rec8/ScpA/Scc1 (kleisin family)